MPLSRKFVRPEDLLASIFVEGNPFGFVQWKLTAEDNFTTFWEAEGYEVQGAPFEKPSSKVVRLDQVQDFNRTFDDSIVMELVEALIGRGNVPPLSFGRGIDGNVRDFLQNNFFEIRGTGITQTRLPVVTFFRPSAPAPPTLPQNKRRRRGLLIFGVKKTRSNAKDFINVRVPHK